MKKTLIITDFDGTLFDTFLVNYKSYQTAFKLCGLSLDIDTYKQCFGLRFNEFMNFVGITDVSIQQKIKTIKAAEYIKNVDCIRLNKNLVNFLKLAKENGITICVASTASKTNLMNVLTHFKIDNLFSFIVTGEDVENGKPSPEVYLKTIEIAGIIRNRIIQPSEVLIFEDSDVGIQAANAAGIDYIQVIKF